VIGIKPESLLATTIMMVANFFGHFSDGSPCYPMTTLDRSCWAESFCNSLAGHIDQIGSSSMGQFYQKTKIGTALILDFIRKL
jgi:hypothetical protein